MNFKNININRLFFTSTYILMVIGALIPFYGFITGIYKTDPSIMWITLLIDLFMLVLIIILTSINILRKYLLEKYYLLGYLAIFSIYTIYIMIISLFDAFVGLYRHDWNVLIILLLLYRYYKIITMILKEDKE